MASKILTLAVFAAAWIVASMTIPATLGAQPAARMRFESMDTNGDGAISREEWRGSPQSFTNHDWNGDGRLAGDEVRIGAQRGTNWDTADHDPDRFERYVSWTAAGFTNLDHNRDRRITANEWHFDRETFRRVDRNRDGSLSETEFLGANYDDDRVDSFDDLDWNNNGRVERSEWHGSNPAFTDLDRNRDGALSRFEMAGGSDWTTDTRDEFAALDFNRNGVLTRDEWHWSATSFGTLDTNRDGRLSRAEFDRSGGAPGAVGTSGAMSQTVRVNALQRWTDSGLNVRAGDSIAIDASGNIQMSDNDQDTANPAGSVSGRRAPDAPILNQPAGALIARIDNYGPIYVGDRRSFVAPASGRLYFGVNDDHLADNRGEFNVNVTDQGRR
jgi:Ca2+-binding EF-hand superfamily protein